MSRCTGHCCWDFTVGISLYEIAQMAKQYSAVEWSNPEIPQQPIKLLEMLLPLYERVTEEGEVIYHYGCIHLQPNGDCGNYTERPNMCKDYPYGQECRFKGCTYSVP